MKTRKNLNFDCTEAVIPSTGAFIIETIYITKSENVSGKRIANNGKAFSNSS